jgi:hypothetical protein
VHPRPETLGLPFEGEDEAYEDGYKTFWEDSDNRKLIMETLKCGCEKRTGRRPLYKAHIPEPCLVDIKVNPTLPQGREGKWNITGALEKSITSKRCRVRGCIANSRALSSLQGSSIRVAFFSCNSSHLR